MEQGAAEQGYGFHAYWGKASPGDGVGDRYHLLSFHSLDVAACGEALLGLPQFSLERLAGELNWPRPVVERLFVFFLALHDLGKYSRAFQALVPHLSPALVPPHKSKRYEMRHDSLGWLLWDEDLKDVFPDARLTAPDDEFWGTWLRSSVGHHGKPPQENAGGGVLQLDVSKFFLLEDRVAAKAFTAAVATQLLPEGIPRPGRREREVLRRHAWRLAGLAVLADWLGSNQHFFPYRSQPCPLSEYWVSASGQARQAFLATGLAAHQPRTWQDPLRLFEHVTRPTPLQKYAAEIALEPNPQLFLLEDVTGAGKTEAALVLAQRLMQAGFAKGLYFALPSMATANQMYQRVGQVYRHLYEPGADPSIILAHGARQLVEGFRQSVVQSVDQARDRDYGHGEASASTTCNAWLADNRKKALLAEVGVGTIDQVLLAILPARHQSLRMLGLSGKVLLVDEVHAYDDYMLSLLKCLLTAHARQGGSVILLSATLPVKIRTELIRAYRFGRGCSHLDIPADFRYPLATRAGSGMESHACATRPELVRSVQVCTLHTEAEIQSLLIEQAAAGRCVCWIRNTVADARQAFAALREVLPADQLTLFHSRLAMGDRLDIEDDVLRRFGKESTGPMRRGHVLVATQVVEQSLDLDFDVLISDLAPIDLLIQRAGRLQRHVRQADGSPAKDGIERRSAPVLYLLCPALDGHPAANWYSALFPKACYVYPDSGRLWLGAKALIEAGCIVSPGGIGERGAVRELVEAVYAAPADAIPAALQKANREQVGKGLASQSQAGFNALKLDMGYCIDSSPHWYEDADVPTRLGEVTRTLYLARACEDGLQPLCSHQFHAWEQSSVRIDARHVETLSADWARRFESALCALRSRHRLLEEPALVLPLQEINGVLRAYVCDREGKERELRYDPREGLQW